MKDEDSEILPFSPAKKGRIRKSRSMDAAGNLSLMLLARDGKAIPKNVVRADRRDWPDRSLPTRTPALFLAVLIHSKLSKRNKDSIERMARQAAFEGHHEAAQALNFLTLLQHPQH